MNLRLLTCFLLLSCTALLSCKRGPLKGYTKITDSYGYRIVNDQDTGTLSGKGVYMIAVAVVKNEKDSVVQDPSFGDSTGFSLQVHVQPPTHRSELMQVFQLLSDGDSAIIKMAADTFFSKFNMNRPLPQNVRPGSFITLHMKVFNLLDNDEYIDWQDEKEFQDKAAAYSLFQSYLETAGITSDPVGSGIIMEHEREGKGRNPKFGDGVLIHYMMLTFGGTELANTYTAGNPYYFTLGGKEVVYGLNEGLLRMKKGGKCRIYIPYYLGYGKEGVPGYVGPYTHLIIDVELLDIL